ncbi:endonuclease III [Candidatus Aminicenantes bacterium AH-873-B07]|jgi:endonuclease-3|nr:endonuclease III [Candidatus Aminicenantes bacterium AH-873-B07]
MNIERKKQFAKQLVSLLKTYYPNAKVALNFTNSWELLVAVVLSAQCTDERVNQVTKKLFKKYKTVEDYAKANLKEFEQDIKPTGFYKNKAKNIINIARILMDNYKGKVPNNMEELLKLPGVARKTANIVLGNAFGIVEGIAVDTHVRRLAERLGLSDKKDPIKIEKDLMEVFDKKDWFKVTYMLIDHGRAICEAKKPRCDQCFLDKICPSAFKFPHFKNP